MSRKYKRDRVQAVDGEGNLVFEQAKDSFGYPIPGSPADQPVFVEVSNWGVEEGGSFTRWHECPVCGFSYPEDAMVEINGVWYSIEYGCAEDVAIDGRPAHGKLELP